MPKPTEIKTKQTESSVQEFLDGLVDDQQRKDSAQLIDLMQKLSKEPPKMWGGSKIGFGNIIYTSPKTGRQVEWFKIGFSPLKGKLSLHLVFDVNAHADELAKLGKHKTGVGCLYVKKLADVDMDVLKGLVAAALDGK